MENLLKTGALIEEVLAVIAQSRETRVEFTALFSIGEASVSGAALG